MNRMDKGFTLAEIVIVLGIMALIMSIGTYAFVSARRSSGLSTLTDTVALTLERARADALAGKNGKSAGVDFATTSYTYFSGSAYSASDPSDVTTTLDSGYQMTNTFTTTSGAAIFARLYGTVQATGSIKITDTGRTNASSTITIGSQGDITVVK